MHNKPALRTNLLKLDDLSYCPEQLDQLLLAGVVRDVAHWTRQKGREWANKSGYACSDHVHELAPQTASETAKPDNTRMLAPLSTARTENRA